MSSNLSYRKFTSLTLYNVRLSVEVPWVFRGDYGGGPVVRIWNRFGGRVVTDRRRESVTRRDGPQRTLYRGWRRSGRSGPEEEDDGGGAGYSKTYDTKQK